MQQGKQQPQHHPAVDPAFWNITRNSKLGEFESGMTQMLFNQALDYHKQNQALKNRIKRLEQSAQEIDNEWFQVIESILGFHPVSMTEALRIGIERIKKQNQRIQHLEDIINRAHLAFFSDSSDRKLSIAMHRILDEEVRKGSQ